MNYTDPFRLRVLKALSDSIAAISIADGYKHDLANRVFRGRDTFGQNDPIPMICIMEPPLPIDRLPAPVETSIARTDWDLLVQGFCRDDHQNPTDPAHMLMADVKRKLTLESKRVRANDIRKTKDVLGMGVPSTLNGSNIGNVVESMKVGPGVVRPPDAGVSEKAYFWLTLTLKIVEDNENPFL